MASGTSCTCRRSGCTRACTPAIRASATGSATRSGACRCATSRRARRRCATSGRAAPRWPRRRTSCCTRTRRRCARRPIRFDVERPARDAAARAARPRCGATPCRGAARRGPRASSASITRRSRSCGGSRRARPGRCARSSRGSRRRPARALIECACRPGRRPCVHALALIDARSTCSRCARAPTRPGVAAELLRPGWSRALEALARFDDDAAPAPRAADRGLVAPRARGARPFAAVAARQEAAQARRHPARARAIAVARLLDEHRDGARRTRPRIAEQLAGWSTRRCGGHLPEPRVPRARRSSARRDARRRRADRGRRARALGFTALPVGAIDPPRAGGRRRARRPAARSPRCSTTFAPGEPLVYIGPDRARVVADRRRGRHPPPADVLDRHGDDVPAREPRRSCSTRLARIEATLPSRCRTRSRASELAPEPVIVVRVRLVPDVTLELELFVRPAPGAPLFRRPRGRATCWSRATASAATSAASSTTSCRRARHARAAAGARRRRRRPAALLPHRRHRRGARARRSRSSTPPPGLEAEWIDAARRRFAPAIDAEALRVRSSQARLVRRSAAT